MGMGKNQAIDLLTVTEFITVSFKGLFALALKKPAVVLYVVS